MRIEFYKFVEGMSVKRMQDQGVLASFAGAGHVPLKGEHVFLIWEGGQHSCRVVDVSHFYYSVGGDEGGCGESACVLVEVGDEFSPEAQPKS